MFIFLLTVMSRNSDISTGPEVFKTFSWLSMNFFLFINVEMPTAVGISIFMSRKNSNLGLSGPKKIEFLDIFTCMSI